MNDSLFRERFAEAITSVFLFIILKPILIISKIFLNKEKYKELNFRLIAFCNGFFLKNKKTMSEFRQNVIYDMRVMRDKYDHDGLQLYFELVPPKDLAENKRILDLGCGVGGKCEELLKYNPEHVFGIELSERNINYALELIKPENEGRLKFELKDLLEFDDKKEFDTIVSYTVFEHISRDIMGDILNKMASVLKDNGNVLIVFNHFNDRFGSHLKEYIYHPWPQTIFDENILYEFWNKELVNDPTISNDSYFPLEYKHGITDHNADCYMNLNKITIEEFESYIQNSNLKLVNKNYYSKSPLLKKYSFLPKKHLTGSVVYHLKHK